MAVAVVMATAATASDGSSSGPAAATARATAMMGVLKKIQKMSSDDNAIYDSAVTKLFEFYSLNYPYKMLWGACTTMGVNTRYTIWFEVRKTLKEQSGN